MFWNFRINDWLSLRILYEPYCSSGGIVAYSESQSEINTPPAEVNEHKYKKKRIVVLGTGWAGVSFLKNLDVSSYDVQVVSPRNYFAFTPLLPSVTCGTVEARSIAEPVRNIIKKVDEKGKSHNFICVLVWYVKHSGDSMKTNGFSIFRVSLLTDILFITAEKWRN